MIHHYCDVTMNAMVSQITGVSIVYSIFCSDADQRKHRSFGSLAFVRGIHWWPVNSPHKGPVTRQVFPFDDVIISLKYRKGSTNQWILSCLTEINDTIRWSDRNILLVILRIFVLHLIIIIKSEIWFISLWLCFFHETMASAFNLAMF